VTFPITHMQKNITNNNYWC